MAATRLIAMHVNKGKTVADSLRDRTAYALNDEKTEMGEYVSSYACNAEIADLEFVQSKQEYFRITGRKPKGDIIAYQIRQSFKPGEISPEEANQVGYETVMRFTKGNHAFIVATHTDKAHLHNHIVFNSTNLDCDRKFRDSWFIALALQKVSDLVCIEHGLSVIKPRKPGERTKRTQFPKRDVFREKICADMDYVFSQNPESLEAFLSELSKQQYEIKRGKDISIRGIGQKRFARFSSLGPGYSLEEIKDRLDCAKGNAGKKRYVKKEFDMLIDIQEKLKQGKSGGYSQWAKVYNIKQLAQSLLFLEERDIRDYEKLSALTIEASARFHKLSEEIKESEKRLAEIAVLRMHIINYSKTRDTYVAYRKAGYSKKFLEENREAITLHKVAKDAFGNLPDEKIPRIKELNAEYAKVLQKKKAAYSEYRQAKKEMQSYLTAKHNIDSFQKMQRTEKKQEIDL